MMFKLLNRGLKSCFRSSHKNAEKAGNPLEVQELKNVLSLLPLVEPLFPYKKDEFRSGCVFQDLNLLHFHDFDYHFESFRIGFNVEPVRYRDCMEWRVAALFTQDENGLWEYAAGMMSDMDNLNVLVGTEERTEVFLSAFHHLLMGLTDKQNQHPSINENKLSSKA